MELRDGKKIPSHLRVESGFLGVGRDEEDYGPWRCTGEMIGNESDHPDNEAEMQSGDGSGKGHPLGKESGGSGMGEMMEGTGSGCCGCVSAYVHLVSLERVHPDPGHHGDHRYPQANGPEGRGGDGACASSPSSPSCSCPSYRLCPSWLGDEADLKEVLGRLLALAA